MLSLRRSRFEKFEELKNYYLKKREREKQRQRHAAAAAALRLPCSLC
jgi:hypothetical protein